jgi:hypothetical protein
MEDRQPVLERGEPMQFPRLKARDLEGRTVELPEGLDGVVNLVVLAFRRDHQYTIETWLPHFARLEEDFPGLEVWEVPALSRSYRIWRGAIDGGMRAGIPEPRVRRHTLTTYTDLRGLQRALDLPDLDEIHLFLLDRSGSIRWRGRGAYSEATLAQLTAALETLSGAS